VEQWSSGAPTPNMRNGATEDGERHLPAYIHCPGCSASGNVMGEMRKRDRRRSLDTIRG